MMNVASPEQPIEECCQVVMAANDIFLDGGATDHGVGSTFLTGAVKSTSNTVYSLVRSISPKIFSSSVTPTAPNALLKGVIPKSVCLIVKLPRRCCC